MSATDVPCPVCGARKDEKCQPEARGRTHKARTKFARKIRHKMTPPWKPGGDRS